MASYAELQKQIAELEAQANALKNSERAEWLTRVRQVVKEYDFTAKELGLGGAGTRTRRSAAGAGVPKYRDPASGATWTGFGRKPGWLAGAKDVNDFLIDKPATTAKRAKKA